MTRGDVTVRGIDPDYLEIALDKVLVGRGRGRDRAGRVPGADGRRPTAVDTSTLPFPGFATDLLPMAIGLAAGQRGRVA